MNLLHRLCHPSVATDHTFVSRGGLKLHAALEALHLNIQGQVAADLGCHIGGFTDCLLQHGAARVYAVDTAYGLLAWKLRRDPRVVVFERRNALHLTLPEPMDLVTIDVGWTRQAKILPAAALLLRPGGNILSLVKPHYENTPAGPQRGVLTEPQALATLAAVLKQMEQGGFSVLAVVQSPLQGQGGNHEFIVHLAKPASPPPRAAR